MRRSEIAGLTWSEVDMDRRMVHISKTKVSDGKTVYVKDKNKTKRSYRTIRMSEEAYRFFVELRRKQAEDKIRHGSTYHDNDFVCKLPNGAGMTPNYMSHKVSELSKETGIEIGLHGLRHTAASIMIAQGANMKQIQATMGHEQISTTFDTYGQLDFEDTIAPVEALSAALSDG